MTLSVSAHRPQAPPWGEPVRVLKSAWHRKEEGFGTNIRGVRGPRVTQNRSTVLPSFPDSLAGPWAVSHGAHRPRSDESDRSCPEGSLWGRGGAQERGLPRLGARGRLGDRQGYEQQGQTGKEQSGLWNRHSPAKTLLGLRGPRPGPGRLTAIVSLPRLSNGTLVKGQLTRSAVSEVCQLLLFHGGQFHTWLRTKLENRDSVP